MDSETIIQNVILDKYKETEDPAEFLDALDIMDVFDSEEVQRLLGEWDEQYSDQFEDWEEVGSEIFTKAIKIIADSKEMHDTLSDYRLDEYDRASEARDDFGHYGVSKSNFYGV